MADLMSEDPAAEFLQQEGDQLRELGIEDAQFSATPPPAVVPAPAPIPADDPFVDPFEPVAADPFNDPFADPIPAATPLEEEPAAVAAAPTPPPAAVVANDVNFMNEFEAELDMGGGAAQGEPLVNGFPDLGGMGGGESPVPMVQQPIHQIVPSEEPESLIKWRDEKAALLQQQERDEAEASLAWSEKAKKETEDWYNRYNEQLEKVQNENRAAESQFIEEMTDTKPGNEWEKVARFCDFNPKFSKNTKDVSRMRSLLLQLKQNPLVR